MKISPIRYNYNQSFLGFRSEKDNENKGFVDTINSKIPTSFTRTQVVRCFCWNGLTTWKNKVRKI